jgi:beta-glucosidase
MTYKKTLLRTLLACSAATLVVSASAVHAQSPAPNPWMAASIVAEQAATTDDAKKEATANRRAKLLIAAMSRKRCSS